MEFETAIRRIYEEGFRAKTTPRTYKLLGSTDEMIKELSGKESVSASDIVKASVLIAYDAWKSKQGVNHTEEIPEV